MTTVSWPLRENFNKSRSRDKSREFPPLVRQNIIPDTNTKKSRGPGVYSLAPEARRASEAIKVHQRSPVRSPGSGPTAFLRSPKKTISTSNLINSGTESDNSYGMASSVSGSGGSRTSSNLSSPTPTNIGLGPYYTNQVSNVINVLMFYLSGAWCQGQVSLPRCIFCKQTRSISLNLCNYSLFASLIISPTLISFPFLLSSDAAATEKQVWLSPGASLPHLPHVPRLPDQDRGAPPHQLLHHTDSKLPTLGQLTDTG